MRKSVSDRVAYYTLKFTEFVSIRPGQMVPKSHTFRLNRLHQYKEAMHKQIDNHHNRISKVLQER